MEELIKVKNDNGELLVSARDLHEGLKVQQDFSHWIKNQLENVDAENNDYIIIWNNTNNNDDVFKNFVNHTNNTNINSMVRKGYKQDYILKIDIAKEICLVAGVAPRTNEETRRLSKTYRKYLIKCEERLRTISQVPTLSLPDDIKKEINNFKEDANYIREHVHIKKLDSSVYVKTIKNYLGISTISEDKVGYEFIKDMFFAEMGVTKFEDITVSSDNLVKLNECCKKYKRPYEQLNIFD